MTGNTAFPVLGAQAFVERVGSSGVGSSHVDGSGTPVCEPQSWGGASSVAAHQDETWERLA